jgi:hypothetical protein
MKNENYIQSLVEDDNLKQTKLSFKADDQILKLLNSVNSFANIIIESGEVDIEAYKQSQVCNFHFSSIYLGFASGLRMLVVLTHTS